MKRPLGSALMLTGGLLAASGAPADRAAEVPSGDDAARGLLCPILMYHRVGAVTGVAPPTQRAVTCAPDVFRAHLDLLEARGYRTTTFPELEAALERRTAPPRRPVLLSFDDGTDDHWSVFEELRSRGMKATFFVVSERVGDAGRLSAPQLSAMRQAGMEIGSHSETHPDLTFLDADAQAEEILGSGNRLAALQGAPALSFAYPGGSYDARSIGILQRSRYRFARTTVPGLAVVSLGDFQLPSVHIHEDTSAADLEALLVTDTRGPCRRCGVRGARRVHGS